MTSRRSALIASGLSAAMTAVLFAACAVGAQAAEPPLGDRKVTITAREQPIGTFLQSFFGQLGLPVSLSPGLTGTVNGAWNDRATKVYRDVSWAFNLLTYFDGQMVYVAPATETASRTLPAPPGQAARARASLMRLGLPDDQNRVRVVENALVATGSRRFLDQAEEQVRNQPTASVAGELAPVRTVRESLEYRVYYLRYAWAEDITLNSTGRAVMVPGVASILRSVMADDDSSPTVRRTEQGLPATVPGLRGQGLSTQGRYPAGLLGYDPAGGPMPAPAATGAWNDTAARPTSVGGEAPGGSGVRVQADSRLNAVIVRDTRARLDAYEPLIRALDVEPQLLEIQATIIDVDTSRVRDLGSAFNFTSSDGRQVVTFGDPAGTLPTDPRNTGRGLVISALIRDGAEFRARLTALEANGSARVISRPQVVTLSNAEAVFDTSRTFYVRLAGERDVDLFNITAGTTLKVTPHVMRDNDQTRIRLLIDIEDGTITGDRVDQIPIVQRSTIATQAMIDAGQSLLLGGMVVQSDERATDKVPLLGDVPIVGNIFKSSKRSSARIERLFLITPRLTSPAGMPTPSVEVTMPGQPLPPSPPLPATQKKPPAPPPAPAASAMSPS